MIDFDAVRALAVLLPAVEEGPWYGAPAFRVRGRVFARLHENDADLFLLKVGPDERDALVAEQPARFLTTTHRSERDESVLMRLGATAPTDLPELAELLETAWRRIAPPRLHELLEGPA